MVRRACASCEPVLRTHPRRPVSWQWPVIALLLTLSTACTTVGNGKYPHNFIEYYRGAGSPGPTDLTFKSAAGETRLHDLHMEGLSFFEDNSIIPNAFLKPLFQGDFGKAINAFTEPYYGYRFVHFMKDHPRWGVGFEFTHLKTFMADPDQRVRVTGPWPGVAPDGTVRLGDHFSMLNISHGVNHAAFNGEYRWMLHPTERVPDGRFQPYVSATFGPAVPHLELDVIEGGQVQRVAYHYNVGWANWGMGAGAGLRWRLTPHVGVFGEYKLTYSILHDMHYLNDDSTKVEMDFFTNHLLWGVSFGL